MPTAPVRVTQGVHEEVTAAARLLGCSPAELLERAWNDFRSSPAFQGDFDRVRSAFVQGDLDQVVSQMRVRSQRRAQQRAQAAAALQNEG